MNRWIRTSRSRSATFALLGSSASLASAGCLDSDSNPGPPRGTDPSEDEGSDAPADTGADTGPNATPTSETSSSGSPVIGGDTSGDDTTGSSTGHGDTSGPSGNHDTGAGETQTDTGSIDPPPEDEFCDELQDAAQAILVGNCSTCHNPTANTGNFADVDNVLAMLRSGMLVAGDPDSSLVFRRIENGTMPPAGTTPRPDADDTEIMRDWITSCLEEEASEVFPACDGDVISEASMIAEMTDDITSIQSGDRQFIRYFTLTHLHNSGICGDALDIYRSAMSKTINSLSIDPRMTRPEPIDTEETIYRIDLRDYGWDAIVGQDKWDLLVEANPYAFERIGSDADTLKDFSETNIPFQAGDWLVHGATVSPLYYDMLELPNSLSDLEAQLGLDIEDDIITREVARSGFLESEVATNNRVIERHEQPTAIDRYLWISYDFAAAVNNKNIFANPVDFDEDVSQLIFSLSNGLQAYMIVDAAGNRLNEAPINIVTDPRQDDRTVRNGISCMGCHYDGIKFKEDEVRDFVLSSLDFDNNVKEIVEDIYPSPAAFSDYVDADAEFFADSVSRTWPSIEADDEPIQYAFTDFERPVDLERAAAEFGIAPNALLQALGVLDPSFAVLTNGVIQRDTFETFFAQSVCRLNLGLADDIDCDR